jgi:hypothetical protein
MITEAKIGWGPIQTPSTLEILDATRKVVILRGATDAPSYRYDLARYEEACREAGIDPDLWEGIR